MDAEKVVKRALELVDRRQPWVMTPTGVAALVRDAIIATIHAIAEAPAEEREIARRAALVEDARVVRYEAPAPSDYYNGKPRQ